MRRALLLPSMLIVVLAAVRPSGKFDPQGEPRPVFMNAGMGSWSPQADRMCYARIPDGGIVTFDFATRQTAEVSATGIDPSWSPGAGHYIAFMEAKPAPAPTEIWIADLMTGNKRQVGHGFLPHWLSDGTTVCFGTRVGDKSIVYALDVSDPAARPRVLLDAAHSFYPMVSPNGEMVVDWDTENMRILSLASKREIARVPWKLAGLLAGWSPDSRQVAFGSYAGTEEDDLWLYDLATNKRTRVAAGKYTLPRFSPDGKGLFVDQRSEAGWHLYFLGDRRLIEPPTPPEDNRRKVALLVGVEKYEKPGFTDLSYAEDDVEAVAHELRGLGFQVTMLKGSADADARATRENIDATVRRLVQPLGKQDMMLVMLSGHGQQLKVPGADDEKEEAFFCPVDAVHNDPQTQFSLSMLLDEILGPNVGHKLVLVDACRNAPKDPGRGSRGIQGREISLPEDTAVLFSCRAGQESWEPDAVQHGIFTYCLLEALRGRGAVDGEIAWTDVVSYVSRRMHSADIRRHMPKPQEPISAGAIGYLVLGRPKAGSK